MKYTTCTIVLQEVPGEVSLAFSISNCPLRCLYCHSPQLRTDIGTPLTVDQLQAELDSCRSPHTGMYTVTCVLFFGGDQHEPELLTLLEYCRKQNLRTCLYTGHTDVSNSLKSQLDYLKVGPYVDYLGALDKSTTNQRFYRLSDNADLTHLFWSN